MYPEKWRHGDWVKITPRGSGVILGRSDSTINRMGVRMGSSEFYAAVEDLPEVVDSLVIGFDSPEGKYLMPLFVVLKQGVELNDTLKTKINKKIRNTLSPRHVPDMIYAVPEVPKTLNEKKIEKLETGLTQDFNKKFGEAEKLLHGFEILAQKTPDLDIKSIRMRA